jgi:hypothetical protein
MPIQLNLIPLYWPGRWYSAPGFGDNRSWPPYAEGVWSR